MYRAAAKAKIDALLISRPQDVTYLSGFTGEDSTLLMGRTWARLITDGRFDEQAAGECPDVDFHVRDGAMFDAVAEQVKGCKVRRLGIQADHLTVRGLELLRRKLGQRRTTHGVSGVVPALRAAKSREEVRAIRKAIRVAEQAFEQLLAGGAKAFVGRSERTLAAELDYRMRLAGAREPAFETIVAAGAHGSLPHYRPGPTVIRRGQAVLIDWGARVDGYCSDLTRVVFIGRIPPEIAEVYEVVLSAERAGIAAIRPGVACKTVDAEARKVIESAGYDDRFLHGLGHGIGLEIHEAPTLGRTSTVRLRSGMIVTVEPGIYLPGVGGVRIEDDVLVTPRGRRKLSSLPRDAAAMIVR